MVHSITLASKKFFFQSFSIMSNTALITLYNLLFGILSSKNMSLRYIPKCGFIKNYLYGAREMTQQLKAMADHPEDTGSTSQNPRSILQLSVASVPGHLAPSFGHLGTYMVHAHTGKQNTQTYTQK